MNPTQPVSETPKAPPMPVPDSGGGLMVYPTAWYRKLFFRMPLYAWRLGFAPIVGQQFAVLTTRGRKTGLPRRTMLEFSFLMGKVFLVSGWGERSDWVRNIQADPRVTVQTARTGAIGGTAKRVTSVTELTTLFNHMRRSPTWEPYLAKIGVEPNVDAFASQPEKSLIYSIEPSADMPLPPQRADLWWVWLALAGSVAGLIALGRRGD